MKDLSSNTLLSKIDEKIKKLEMSIDNKKRSVEFSLKYLDPKEFYHTPHLAAGIDTEEIQHLVLQITTLKNVKVIIIEQLAKE